MFALKEIPLFSRLTAYQLNELQSQMHIHQYEKESIVFYEGDESDYLQVLLSGAVRLYKTSPKGTQVHMHNFTAPEIVALFAAFENIPYPATCEFITDGVIGLIPLEKIYSCMENVDFSRSLVSALSKRMKLLADLLHKETIYTSEAKIADLVMSNATIFQHLKNNEIASILNMTPETLSRILTKFKKEKIITLEEHILTILDAEALMYIIETNAIKK